MAVKRKRAYAKKAVGFAEAEQARALTRGACKLRPSFRGAVLRNALQNADSSGRGFLRQPMDVIGLACKPMAELANYRL
jgi:hypothetical protein